MVCPMCGSLSVITEEVFDYWCLNGYTTDCKCDSCGFIWYDDTVGGV